MVIFSQYRVLVFQVMSYRCVLCRIVFCVVPVSVLHRQQVPTHNSEQHCPNLGLASSLVSGVLPSFACTLGK